MMKNAVLGCGEGPWETKSCLRGKPLQHAPWPWAPCWGDHHTIIVASDVDHVGVGGDDIFELMVMIIRMIRADGVSFPQLEELISPHMCRPKPRISNEEKQVVDVLYISRRFAP